MKKKELILQAAAMIFADKGFREASMSELAKSIDVAESTIFYHFKTKEDLFVAILEKIREEITREFVQYTRDKTNAGGMEMLEDAVSFYLYLACKLEHPFLLLQRHFAHELAVTNPVCRAHLENIYNCLVDIFEDAIRRGQADGSIIPVHTRKTALILFSMVDGIVRFKTLNLYDASALYHELLASCRRMLSANGNNVQPVT